MVASIRNALRPERPSIYAGAFAAPAPAAFGAPGFGTATFGTSSFGTSPFTATAAPPPPAAAPASSAGWGAPTATATAATTGAAPEPFSIADPVGAQRTRVASKLLFGIVGSAIAVLGLHMTIGGGIGTFAGMWNPLWTICDGPLCVVGVDSGPVGLTLGVFVAIFGFGVRAHD